MNTIQICLFTSATSHLEFAYDDASRHHSPGNASVLSFEQGAISDPIEKHTHLLKHESIIVAKNFAFSLERMQNNFNFKHASGSMPQTVDKYWRSSI